MIPQINDNVRLVLRNSTIVDGIVVSWSNTQIILEDHDKKSIIIINDPKDILLIRIFTSKPIEPIKSEKYTSKETIELKLKSIADLKEELIKQEQQEVISKIKSHEIDSEKIVKYELPTFLKKQE